MRMKKIKRKRKKEISEWFPSLRAYRMRNHHVKTCNLKKKNDLIEFLLEIEMDNNECLINYFAEIRFKNVIFGIFNQCTEQQ